MTSPPQSPPWKPPPGRGSGSRMPGRFATESREAFDDGWAEDEDPPPRSDTRLHAEQARAILSRNDSPDIPFDRSVNPYRGCEHGCIYCFARPSHAYLDLSPGLDFETEIYYKANAVERLDATLRRPGYRCRPIHIGANTDPYQPAERRLRISRGILELLLAHRHPLTLVTKGSTLVLRDLDLYARLAEQDLVSVAVSMTTLDAGLKRRLEPRAASAATRLRVMAGLAGVGVPVTALVAPVIPGLTDHELEALLQASRDAGASRAGYALLRLPHEVAPLFRDWLQTHYPDRAGHVLHLLRDSRGGREYDSRFGQRHRGSGCLADLIAQRFRLACRRLGLAERHDWQLDASRFRPPARSGDQLALW